MSTRKQTLIAAAAARRAETWADEISELYGELMSSLQDGIWENYPEEGKAVRRIRLYPIFKGEHPREGVYPDFPKSLFGLVLQPEVNGVETAYHALIPIDKLPSGGSKNYWVRVRINKDTAVDQQVIRTQVGMQLASLRWIGRPVDGVRLRPVRSEESNTASLTTVVSRPTAYRLQVNPPRAIRHLQSDPRLTEGKCNRPTQYVVECSHQFRHLPDTPTSL